MIVIKWADRKEYLVNENTIGWVAIRGIGEDRCLMISFGHEDADLEFKGAGGDVEKLYGVLKIAIKKVTGGNQFIHSGKKGGS